jgi:hypothetical protein
MLPAIQENSFLTSVIQAPRLHTTTPRGDFAPAGGVFQPTIFRKFQHA